MLNNNVNNFALTRKSRIKAPRLSFKEIKNDILGPEYSLSLVFIGDITSRKLNKKYRKKNKPTNILSFPLSSNEGEIFINLRKAREEAHLFDMSFSKFTAYLFIHGLLHLKGMQHGCTMNKKEMRLLRRYVD
jgi:probable rRNA maturation factor